MAKDPAFLFYTGDFTTGTQFFTDEQVGIYLRLLMAQHQHGRLSEKHMNLICKTYDKDVYSKFERDNDGLYYNERLELEVIRRKNFCESRGKNRSSKNNTSISYDNHMENKNENKDINISKHEFFKNECLQSQQWLETIAMNIKIPLDKIQLALTEFNNHLIMDGEVKQDLKDYKNHFTRWSRKVKQLKSS